MNKIYPILCFCMMAACQNNEKNNAGAAPSEPQPAEYALVLHGGAGTIRRKDLSTEKEVAIRDALNQALNIGEAVLKDGGSALDAVEKVIVYLENDPHFNAGRGAVFTHDGKNELDASIMDGKTQQAGAVGGVTTVKNPIRLARKVMENSPHVLLTGRGAEQFATEMNLETAPPDWFRTPERWESLQKALDLEKNKAENPQKLMHRSTQPYKNWDGKFGTVGCVALDKQGNLAAGTSTGGMTNKRWNRFGDTPIIGAATYADNQVCGISCTGHGEFFIRYAVAHDVWALMSYKNMPVQAAADLVIQEKLKQKGGEGGLIALDRLGNVAMSFNSEGMYRAFLKAGGERKVEFYR